MPRIRRRTLIAATAAAAVVVTAVALPLFQPWRLFTGKVVDEALPGADPISMTTSSSAAPTISGDGTRPTAKTPTVTPPVTPPVTPAAGPQRLATGRFITHEHDTEGTASILQLADGSRVLRLEGLRTSDGPDLKVWLSDAKVVAGKAGWHTFDDGKYRNLGNLKGNEGNQNYAIPPDVDPAILRSVSIWCDRFNVSFGAAALA
ncbi:DM13 domain-containing protein [Kribbella catacumbae]|uniref:DM13 domain-containing protein n=1 Tax=Kribbella catacumbae TaxID=460086 RepID=UPI00035D6A95|nr:DM13 domain-containing protein [Kribbella catacumbae]